jgi:hypothetical protein
MKLLYVFILCNLEIKRLKAQKIDFIATGIPIMLSLPQQNGMPPAKSGAQSLNSVT